MPLDATASAAERESAFATMDGLLLSGGADVDPARYGQAVGRGPRRWSASATCSRRRRGTAAEARGLPVLGICRGFQAMNVFAGGPLRQHVDGHAGPGWGHGDALTHPLRIVAGTRLARILYPANVGGGVLTVNSYHHQGVRPRGPRAAVRAGGVVARAATASSSRRSSPPSGPFRMAVQCHPERTESTPQAFERLFAFFVDACRGPAASR